MPGRTEKCVSVMTASQLSLIIMHIKLILLSPRPPPARPSCRSHPLILIPIVKRQEGGSAQFIIKFK